jgi:hypothetical protein
VNTPSQSPLKILGKTSSRTSLCWQIVLLVAFMGATPVLAQTAKTAPDKPSSGALPRGNVPSAGGGVSGPTTVPVVPTNRPKGCLSDFVTPPAGGGAFSADSKSAWVLTRRLGKTGTALQSYLYKVDVVSLQAEPQVSMRMGGDGLLVPLGNPVSGVTTVIFSGAGDGCQEGAATTVSVSLSKASGGAAVSGKGRFALLQGPKGTLMADLAKSAIVETDVNTFQLRTAGKFPSGERPLWFDLSSKNLVTWTSEPRGLILYENGAKKSSSKLSVLPGDRVVQAGDRFLIARIEPATNRILLRELGQWSKSTKPGEFSIELPRGWNVADAALTISPDNRTVLVQGGSTSLRQRWQRAWVFNYATGKPISIIEAGALSWIEWAGMDSRGLYATFELRDLDTRATRGLKVLQITSGKLSDVKLGQN